MNDFEFAVADIVREFGVDALYVKTSQGEYDPATGTVESSVRNIPVRGVLMDFNGLTLKYDTQILAGDKQFFMQVPITPVKIEPLTDVVKVGNYKYKVVTVKATEYGESPVVYELILRR